MTGDTTTYKDNPMYIVENVLNNAVNRRVWFGCANGGNFYIYDNTKNRAIIEYPLSSGVPIFHGIIGAEKLTVVYGSTAATNKAYWAYKFGNWVYINLRGTWPSAISAGQGLFKLLDSSGNVILPIMDNGNGSYSQLLSGTYYPRTARNSNGFNIGVDGTAPANSNVQIWGMFMCE